MLYSCCFNVNAFVTHTFFLLLPAFKQPCLSAHVLHQFNHITMETLIWHQRLHVNLRKSCSRLSIANTGSQQNNTATLIVKSPTQASFSILDAYPGVIVFVSTPNQLYEWRLNKCIIWKRES